MMLIGAEGVGKTLLLFQIVARLQNRAKFVYFHVASDSFEEFVDNLCDEIALDVSGNLLIDKIVQLNGYLKKQKNSRIVVVVDDAQNLKDSVLHDVLLMSTPPNKSRASIQIVLSGLPELEEKYNQLKRKSLALDADKVFLYSLKSMDHSGVAEYVHQRLAAVGYSESGLFDDPVIKRITHHSKGVPLVVNNLCNLSLQRVAEQELKKVSPEIVDEVSISYFAEQAILHPDRPVEEDIGIAEKISQLFEGLPERFAFLGQRASKISAGVVPALKGVVPALKSIKPEYAAIGLVAMSVLAISFYVTQPNVPKNTERRPEVASVDPEIVNPGSNSPAVLIDSDAKVGLDVDSDIASFESDDFDQQGALPDDVIAVVASDTDSTNTDIAREFLASQEQANKSVDLDLVYSKAESLSSENQLKDAYLLYFYAAKNGHGGAAYKLAQFADPQTFEPNMSLLDSPNSVQAHKWYQQAVLAGHPKARSALDQLRSQVERLAASGDERAYQLTLQWR